MNRTVAAVMPTAAVTFPSESNTGAARQRTPSTRNPDGTGQHAHERCNHVREHRRKHQDERDRRQVDDQVTMPRAIELAELRLEGFGRSTRDERFERRQHKAISTRCVRHGMPCPDIGPYKLCRCSRDYTIKAAWGGLRNNILISL